MPLLKVNLLTGRSAERKDSIAASIHAALGSTLGVADEDRITAIGRAHVCFGRRLAGRVPIPQAAG